MTVQAKITLLLICLSASWAIDRQNSKRLPWEDRSAKVDDDSYVFPRVVLGIAPRTDRKIIFINNKAYDMPEEEQSMLWHLFLHEGFVPETAEFVPEPQMDSLTAALDTPGVAFIETSSNDHFAQTNHNVLSGDQYDPESMKTSRLVGVPEEFENETQPETQREEEPPSDDITNSQELTKTSDSAEEEDSSDSKESEPIDISENNKMADVVTVQKMSVLSFLWSHLTSLGGKLGRGVVDTLSDTLWAWWLNVLEIVKSRGLGKSLPEALWTSWVSFLQSMKSRDFGDPLPELLWKSWLNVLQFVKSRGRRSILGLPPE